MTSRLVTSLVDRGILVSPSIIHAFEEVDREDFLPTDLAEFCNDDTELPIGFGQHISCPSSIARMLEWLALSSGSSVLHVGSGSGWTAALLASIVGETGKVFAFEQNYNLHERSKMNIDKFGFIHAGIVESIYGNIYDEIGGSAYDRILITAITTEVPLALSKRLSIGGKMVMPLQKNFFMIEKLDVDKYEEKVFSYPSFF